MRAQPGRIVAESPQVPPDGKVPHALQISAKTPTSDRQAILDAVTCVRRNGAFPSTVS
jgi:hypothetical protein